MTSTVAYKQVYEYIWIISYSVNVSLIGARLKFNELIQEYVAIYIFWHHSGSQISMNAISLKVRNNCDGK